MPLMEMDSAVAIFGTRCTHVPAIVVTFGLSLITCGPASVVTFRLSLIPIAQSSVVTLAFRSYPGLGRDL